ncbi:hypothetical protein CEXT_538791 [Caerostris extrusa]|uniref:Uncharacterized protein n=1 Tax=Caerostris extrusa TaxID=172846 RepID=A0AAV4XVG5_CAEEX|nr:hypothetical protein CEXT_538791 [Caerostris extrusa]
MKHNHDDHSSGLRIRYSANDARRELKCAGAPLCWSHRSRIAVKGMISMASLKIHPGEISTMNVPYIAAVALLNWNSISRMSPLILLDEKERGNHPITPVAAGP